MASLRTRKLVDYKLMNDGEPIPKEYLKEAISVLPETYVVERLIKKKDNHPEKSYLVKWRDYHIDESTWEPESHIPHLLTVSYMNPGIDSIRLANAAYLLESAILQRLSSRSSTVSVKIELDIFRHVFSVDTSTLVYSANQLSKLPLSKHWWYKLKRDGRGTRVSFPMRIKPRLSMRCIYVRDGDSLKKETVPIEKWEIVCAIEPLCI